MTQIDGLRDAAGMGVDHFRTACEALRLIEGQPAQAQEPDPEPKAQPKAQERKPEPETPKDPAKTETPAQDQPTGQEPTGQTSDQEREPEPTASNTPHDPKTGEVTEDKPTRKGKGKGKVDSASLFANS